MMSSRNRDTPTSASSLQLDGSSTALNSDQIDNDFSTPSITQESTSPYTWARFLVMKSMDTDRPLDKVSRILIAKTIASVASETTKWKEIKGGLILIDVDHPAHSINLQNLTELQNGITVQITPHRSLNSCKGVIWAPPLCNDSETEIKSELKKQGVTNVTRLKFKNQQGELLPSHRFILIFDSPNLPQDIKISSLVFKVDPYIPNPLRCNNCQVYGHHQANCQRNKICAKCGKENHSYNECPNEQWCVHCKDSHPASSKQCPEWQLQKEIVRTKHEHAISFPEAKKIVLAKRSTVPLRGNISYAQASKKSSKICEVQTEINFPNYESTELKRLDISKLKPFVDKPTLSTNSSQPETNESQQVTKLKTTIQQLQAKVKFYENKMNFYESSQFLQLRLSPAPGNQVDQTASPPVFSHGGESEVHGSAMDFTESTSKRSLSSEQSDEEFVSPKSKGRPSKKGRSLEESQDSSAICPVSNRFACLEATVTDADGSPDPSVEIPSSTDSIPGSLNKQPEVELVDTITAVNQNPETNDSSSATDGFKKPIVTDSSSTRSRSLLKQEGSRSGGDENDNLIPRSRSPRSRDDNENDIISNKNKFQPKPIVFN